MAAGTIPARVNGSPIPNLSDFDMQAARNVQQRATIKGIKQSKGKWKLQASLTFALDSELTSFLNVIDVTNDDAEPVNLQVDVADGTFNLLNGDANSVAISGDQDGTATCKITMMFEGWQKVL